MGAQRVLEGPVQFQDEPVVELEEVQFVFEVIGQHVHVGAESIVRVNGAVQAPHILLHAHAVLVASEQQFRVFRRQKRKEVLLELLVEMDRCLHVSQVGVVQPPQLLIDLIST